MSHFINIHLVEGALPMLDGETIDAFREAIISAIRADYAARGIIGPDDEGRTRGWLYLIEVFDDFAVVEVDSRGGSDMRQEKVSFTRAPDGAFTLGAPVRVRRKVEWEPVDETDEEMEREANENPSNLHVILDDERVLGVEIETRHIEGVAFPVGHPSAIVAAMNKVRGAALRSTGIVAPTTLGEMQSALDETVRRALASPNPTTRAAAERARDWYNALQ